MSDKDVLNSMGFDPARVEWALRATNNKGLQPAMDFILEHNDDPIPDATSGAAETSSAQPQSVPMDEDDDEETAALRAVYGSPGAADQDDSGVEARSIKCSECGKIFKNTALANFHAEKSGHDQFEESTEEIKPLTEEEKQQKLLELREKMNEKRAKKAAEDAKEAKANELIRRKAGKEASQIKEDLKNKQILKDLEAKRREKEDDKKALAAIKAQIEADKRQRAQKAAQEKALRDGAAPPTDAAGSSAPSAAPAPTSVPGREFKDTRLQIRLASGGQPLTTTLPSDSTLREVAEFVAGQTLTVDVDTVTFTQQFPRKQFSASDFSRSLRDLGLTPSAVLIAS
ncbi:ubiquitin-related domain-containing protein [Lactarius akahatsu]|uniref:Ubiquitin-related domain-containing protein n=1 Tax=Lactarius akahatsu TaxID=416441 RepID=A0AAD4Q857_9AGAM|nr:ubiquitin-related domain-containing protein [Lactarius akahatsu]